MTNLVLIIAWKHVSARVRQTLIGTAAVAMGVGATIMMAGLLRGSQADFLRTLVDTSPHITVGDEHRAVGSQPADQEYAAVGIPNARSIDRKAGIRYSGSVMTALKAWLPGDVAPSVKTTAIIEHNAGRISVTLTGIDPHVEVRVSKLASLIREGQISDLSKAANGIIVGQALAEKLALKVGNVVGIVGGSGVRISATVVAIYRSGMKSVDEVQIYSLMILAQTLMGQAGIVNELRLRLNDPLAAQALAVRVEAQTGYKSVSWQEANAELLSLFTTQNFITLTVMGAMLLSSSFATYNIISTITHEKSQDIAIMKSFGMRERSVRLIFVVESVMIASVGVVFGWAIGSVLCAAWSRITILNPLTGEFQLIQISYSPISYIISGLISALSCAVAGYIPARKATRVHPVEIIRGAS